MTKPWSGRARSDATAWVIARDQGRCWICGHNGADTLDHIVPRSIDPTRTWDPTNWAAAHGAARPDLGCPGQYARGNAPGPQRQGTDPNPRPW